MAPLEFEKKLYELKENIMELKKQAAENGINLDNDIHELEIKLYKMQKEAYKNLTSWDKVIIARLVERPTALDYIERIFDDFIELHGDRYFGDDPAIVGGIGSF